MVHFQHWLTWQLLVFNTMQKYHFHFNLNLTFVLVKFRQWTNPSLSVSFTECTAAGSKSFVISLTNIITRLCCSSHPDPRRKTQNCLLWFQLKFKVSYKVFDPSCHNSPGKGHIFKYFFFSEGTSTQLFVPTLHYSNSCISQSKLQ